MPAMNRKSDSSCRRRQKVMAFKQPVQRRNQNAHPVSKAVKPTGCGLATEDLMSVCSHQWRAAIVPAAAVSGGGADEVAEQRMRHIRTGAEFGVELRTNHERVVTQ